MPSISGNGDPRSAYSNLDLLDRAIMLNEMREETGALMNSNAMGRGIFGAMADISMLSMYGMNADMLLGL